MEPGRRDREQTRTMVDLGVATKPQWSPVDVTGNSSPILAEQVEAELAAMEPGRRDREQIGTTR